MRHRQVVTVVAVALIGLAGCSDHPMNLETYYDDPTTPAAPPTLAPPPPVTKIAPMTTMTTSRPPSPLVRPVAEAVFTDGDLATEGVHPGEPQSKVTACLVLLPAADSAELLRRADWLYPSGSSLTHEVVGYPVRQGAAVVAAMQCPGQPLTMPPASGIDAQRAWCEGSTCTVLLAKGHLVSGVQVTAGSAARASDAAKRLAKIAAAKLVAAQP